MAEEKEMAGLFDGIPTEDERIWTRHVFESVVNGITIADARDPELPLIYVNPAFQRMTGYTLQEVRGRNCRFLQGPDTSQPGLAVLRQALRQGSEVKTVLRNYRKDGTPFWNELYLSPILDIHGRLTHYVGIQNEVTERIQLEAKLAHMAHHDMLTGLPNRSMLLDAIDQAVARAKRSNLGVAVLLFDLDNFKDVNDACGHEVGDAVLKLLAERLQAGTRKYEMAARLGGDEFVVLIEELSSEAEAASAMQRITHDLQQAKQIAGYQFHPLVSAGMGMFPRDGKTPKELLRAADLAMYAMKRLRAEVREPQQPAL